MELKLTVTRVNSVSPRLSPYLSVSAIPSWKFTGDDPSIQRSLYHSNRRNNATWRAVIVARSEVGSRTSITSCNERPPPRLFCRFSFPQLQIGVSGVSELERFPGGLVVGLRCLAACLAKIKGCFAAAPMLPRTVRLSRFPRLRAPDFRPRISDFKIWALVSRICTPGY